MSYVNIYFYNLMRTRARARNHFFSLKTHIHQNLLLKKILQFPLYVIFFTYPFFLASDPWGKDADLASGYTTIQYCSKSHCGTLFLGKFAEKMIQFHQHVISPADGPRSHFIPSSSQYTLNAMRKYGFFKGFIFGCDRLMRENDDPWIYRQIRDGAGKLIKFDPVP